jgi:sensor histidine kinase YesM
MKPAALYIMLLLLLASIKTVAQETLTISIYSPKELEKGISVEPYATFYEDPTGDTLQLPEVIAQQEFLPVDQLPKAKMKTNRQMPRTSQVIWMQFHVENLNPIDTLYLWYSGGAHAVYSIYQNHNGSFKYLGSNGLCVPSNLINFGYSALPFMVPPHSTHHYFVRVTDYLLLLDDTAGDLYTWQSFQGMVNDMIVVVRWLFGAMAIIFGCLLLLCGYAIFQYFLNRDRAFLYYSLYTAMACCFILVLANPRFGLGLTPVSLPWLGHPISFSFNHILALLYALFLSHILNLRQNQPAVWKVIMVMIVVLTMLQCMVVIQLFTGIWFTNNALYFIVDTFPALFTGLILVYATIRSDSKLKGYLLVGQISLYVIAISPVHGMFKFTNVSPEANVFLNYPPFYMMMGLCTELFCFAMALAYRNKLVELEKNQLQENYAHQLESELETRTEEVQRQSLQLENQHIRQIEMDFEQQLAQIQMSALRSQMNPHFIFNCLNSIQLYTTSNNPEKASDYLNRFSQLIRLVLENSRSERITLDSEIQALELYLQMETMRFKDKLKVHIEVASDLDTGLIEIPPLLLQPYVENAIWHGLMHKPEGGSLHIKVELHQPDCLKVIITDDGIGRARSAELKSKSATAHKSFGMKVTGERINLINQLYKTKTKVEIHDLMDPEGNPAGTEVVLEIPV